MRVVIQRVKYASVVVEGKTVGKINKGLLVFAGIEEKDDESHVLWMSNKITNLRIFDDGERIPNFSVKDIDGDILLVSQFTLHASTKKGNRPSYIKAGKSSFANQYYELLKRQLQICMDKPVESGVFGADMQVSLLNDGPVTIIIDSHQKE